MKRINLSEEQKNKIGRRSNYDALYGERNLEIENLDRGLLTANQLLWLKRIEGNLNWDVYDVKGKVVATSLNDEDARLQDTPIYNSIGSAGMWLGIGLIMLMILIIIAEL